jgi:hypothetical protein
MRVLVVLVLPLLIQVLAYVGVFMAAQGGGSFMGLLAMPVAAASAVALLIHGGVAARSQSPAAGAAVVSLLIAVVPPLGLMVFRALES